MIPIGDSVRSRSFPYVNVALIAINFLVFFYEIALSQDTISRNVTELDRFIREWGNIPACTFDAFGRDVHLSPVGRVICEQQSQPAFTAITAMFIHGGWLHVIGNMLFLWIFGDNVEDTFGHLRYGIFYAVAGVIAGFSQAFTDIEGLTPAIGASGAVAGVMGAYIVLFPRATVIALVPFFFFVPFAVPAAVLIGIWFLMQLFSGVSSLGVDAVGAGGGVAYFAHIGGFVAGLALVHVFALGRPRRRVRT
ncbi:MAG: rhomboid family intramembrane serine protease [Dehalococcoidia bacterium]